MVLQNSLFTVTSTIQAEGEFSYILSLNGEHTIYKAHFPGEPITPGVCILQIALELLSLSIRRKIDLKCAKNVKFLNILRPEDAPVTVRIFKIVNEDDMIQARIEMSTEEKAIAKLSLICRIAG